MRSARFVCLFVILSSAMLAAQSNTVPLVNQPAVSKVSSGLSKPDPKTQGRILENYGKLPLSFEANRGQTDARVKFLSRGSGEQELHIELNGVDSTQDQLAKGCCETPRQVLPR